MKLSSYPLDYRSVYRYNLRWDYDFCELQNDSKNNKGYAGVNGYKISIVYNDEVYMLKFPPPLTQKHGNELYEQLYL